MEAFVYITRMWKIRKKHTRTYPTAQMWRFWLIRSSLQENMRTEIHLSHCLEKSPSEQELDYMSLEKSCDKRYTAMFPVADRNRSDSSGGEQLSLCTGLCDRLVYHLHSMYFQKESMDYLWQPKSG